jgi:hypothetical protein
MMTAPIRGLIRVGGTELWRSHGIWESVYKSWYSPMGPRRSQLSPPSPQLVAVLPVYYERCRYHPPYPRIQALLSSQDHSIHRVVGLQGYASRSTAIRVDRGG